MKLLYLEFIKGEYSNPIEGFKHRFHSNTDVGGVTSPICLAGVNGSGKSKLLEVLADIFYYLDNYYTSFFPDRKKTKLQFHLEYVLERSNKHVKIIQEEKEAIPLTYIYFEGEWEVIQDEKVIEKLLPRHVVGYSSGENETLSKRFIDTYINYSEAVTDHTKNLGAKEFKNKVPDTRLVYMDYKVNSYVFVANKIFRSESDIRKLHEKIKSLHSLESFRVTIQLKPRYKNRLIPINLTPELSSYIGALKKCSTCSYYEEENEKWILDFYVNNTSKQLFETYFEDAFDFYTALYKLELLNDILLRRDKKKAIKEAEYPNQKHEIPELPSEERVFLVENVRINLNGNDEDVGYHDLSDGEHQLLHILGTFMMIESPDVLFLLDEPETHFNPQWRSEFISTLSSFKHTRFQEFLITTHSPFILSDCKRENVLIFEEGKARNPEVQTFGLSMERMLQEAFGVIPPMSEKALKEIQKLQKKKSSKEIEKRLDDFGESIEKLYLYERLEELKEREKKK